MNGHDYFDRLAKIHKRLGKMITLSENTEFTNAIMALREDLLYCPPELMMNWAYKMNRVLIQYIGEEPLPGWQTAVLEAYTK